MRLPPPLPCTLDGIAIPVVRIRDQVSRAWVEHGYPGRAKADLEDVGGRPERFEVEAVFTGIFWKIRVDALRSVVKYGPATPTHIFVHPFWGVVYGKVDDLSIEHVDTQENTARATFRFTEGKAAPIAFAVAGSDAATQAAAEAAAAAAAAAVAALPV